MSTSPPSPNSNAPSPAATNRFRISTGLVVALLCLAYLAQCFWFIGTQSFTFDEPHRLYAGFDAWRNGRFAFFNDHPPLAPLFYTLPPFSNGLEIRNVPFNGNIQIYPDAEHLAWRTRPWSVTFGLLLAMAVYFTSRRLFSDGGALLALALFVFSPELIAHNSLTNTDGIFTLFLFLSAVQLLSWRRDPSYRQTILLALVLGGLMVSKYNGPVYFLLAMLLMLFWNPGKITFHPRTWNWGKASLCVLIAFLIIWATFFFHISKVTLADGHLTIVSPNGATTTDLTIPSRARLSFFLPAGEYFVGLYHLYKQNRGGHSAYMFGEILQKRSSPLYFPVAMALKWPVTLLLLFGLAAALAFLGRLAVASDVRLLSIFPLVHLLSSVVTNINIGVRHVLPIYPFMLLLIAACWGFARTRRALAALIVVAVVLQAVDCLRWGPDYLSYFNFYAQPTPGHERLSDSNLDWGQGLIALRNFQAEHPDEPMHLAYFGRMNPASYGIRAMPLLPNERVSGLVVVSATHMTGQYLSNPDSYHWLLKYPLRTVLNHTLYVFDVPAERTAPAAEPPHP